MKNYYKVFILLFLVVLLVGCASNVSNVSNNGEVMTVENSQEEAPHEIRSDALGLTDDELLTLQGQLNEIVESGNLERCKEISVHQYFATCEANILAHTASSSEDIDVCSVASNDVIKDKCEALVKNL